MTSGAGIITFFSLIQAYLLLKTATHLTNLTNGPFLSKEYWKKEIVLDIYFFISFKLFVCFEINFFQFIFLMLSFICYASNQILTFLSC